MAKTINVDVSFKIEVPDDFDINADNDDYGRDMSVWRYLVAWAVRGENLDKVNPVLAEKVSYHGMDVWTLDDDGEEESA